MSLTVNEDMKPHNALALVIRDLGKCYDFQEKPQSRLKAALMPWARTTTHRFWALRGVSFEVPRGEAVGILGRNGSGKSTLLQMIAGVLQPSEGELECHGRISALLELGSGFNPEFTGRENALMNGSILGLSSSQMAGVMGEIIDFADIGEFIDQPVKNYSSGMLVRLAFAVAVAVQPDILIVDEALAVGDIVFQRKCFRRIEEMRERGMTLLFVTHDPGLVRTLCSKCLVLNQGRAAGWGEASEMADLYLRLAYGESVVNEPTVSAEVLEESAQANPEALSLTAIPDQMLYDASQKIAGVYPAEAEGEVSNCMEPFALEPGHYHMEVRLAYQTKEKNSVGVMVADWIAAKTAYGTYFPVESSNPGLQTFGFDFEVNEPLEAAEVRVIRYGAAEVWLSNISLYLRAGAQASQIQPLLSRSVDQMKFLAGGAQADFERAALPQRGLPQISAQDEVTLMQGGILGPQGLPQKYFRTDEEICIVAILRVEKAIDGFQFGVLLRDRFGQDIFGQSRSNEHLGLPGHYEPGAMVRIKCRFRAHLREDVYFVTLGVRSPDWSKTYFYGTDLFQLPIECGNADKVFGLLNLPYQFEAEVIDLAPENAC